MSQPIREVFSLDEETQSLIRGLVTELSPIFGGNKSAAFRWFVKAAFGLDAMQARISNVLMAMQLVRVNKTYTQTNFEFPECAALGNGAVVDEERQRRLRVVSISRLGMNVRHLAVRGVGGAWVPSFLESTVRFPFAHLSTGRVA